MFSENSVLRQTVSELVQRWVKPCGIDLKPASRVLRSDSLWLDAHAVWSALLPWWSANFTDSGRVVGNPSLTGLGKSCPSSRHDPTELGEPPLQAQQWLRRNALNNRVGGGSRDDTT
jgi:hypothetical protein